MPLYALSRRHAPRPISQPPHPRSNNARPPKPAGRPLGELLYVPEIFAVEREAEINQRRMAFMHALAASDESRRSLMMLIGEVKEIAPARYGHRIVIKHLPKFPFMANEDVHRRMNAKFANELAL